MNQHADILLRSDSIFTASGQPAFSGYVAIGSGRILAVGPGKCPDSLIGSDTKIYDLGGRTISPGFSDVHCFFTGYSVGYLGVDLSGASSCDELVQSALNYARGIPADKPVLGHGWDGEQVHPQGTSALDEAFGSRPVVLFAAGCETCWMNQAALDKYQFSPDTCYPEAYFRLMPEFLSDRDFIVPQFRRYMAMMNSKGVTSVKEMGFDRFYGFTDILAELEEKEELTLRVNFMSQPVGAGADLEYGRAMKENSRAILSGFPDTIR